MARTPLPLAQIKKIFSGENLQQALRDLASAKIIAVSGESVKAMSTEFKFPLAETVELKSFYQKFDAWDRSLPQGSTLTERRKKFILRRTSARFIDLIDGLLGHLDQTIKASDENDASLNDEVFVFEYRLCTGRWPG